MSMRGRFSSFWWTGLADFSLPQWAGALVTALTLMTPGAALSETDLQIWIDQQPIAVPETPARITFSDRPNVDTLELVFDDADRTWGARLVLSRSGHGNWRVVSAHVIEDGSDIVLAAGETVDAGRVRLEAFSGSEARASIFINGEFASFTTDDDPFYLEPITPAPPARAFRISVVFDWPE
jgi:hypothetical protein